MNTANSNMQPGSFVRIRAEWLDHPADADKVYTVVENNGDRLIIQSTDPQFRLKPQQLVRACMVEVAE